MDGISCDRCGKGLLLDETVRYIVRLEVTAAYDPMERTREEVFARDHGEEIRRLVEQLERTDAATLEDEVHRSYRFDLCPPCQRWLLEELRREVAALRPGEADVEDGASEGDESPPQCKD